MLTPSAINTKTFRMALSPYIASLPGLIAYWSMQETSGLVAIAAPNISMNGSISGALIGQIATNKLGNAYLFDAVNDYVNIFTAALQSAFTPNLCTVFQFVKMRDVSVWTDGIERRHLNLAVDNNNHYRLYKPTTSNQYIGRFVSGGTLKSRTITGMTTANFFMVAMSVNKASDRMRTYLNGVQQGADVTGLNVWAGSLAATTTTIGAGSTAGVNPSDAYICHTAIVNAELSAATLLQIAQLGGVA